MTVSSGFERRTDWTTGSGEFAFQDLVRQPHIVSINSAGHPELVLSTEEGDANLVGKLTAGARLSGRVRSPDRLPRPYVRVLASSSGGGGDTYSAADGSYLLDGLAPGAYDVHLRDEAGFDVLVASVTLAAGDAR